MDDKKYFENILGNDEKIIKTVRQNKGRVYFSVSIVLIFLALTTIGIPLITYLALKDKELLTYTIVILVFALLILLGILYYFSAKVKNTVYAITNKRLIIRTGILGIGYKSLDYKNLGACNVTINVFDKLYGKDTGTLRFASSSMPMNASGNGDLFFFSNVLNPYQLYKEINQCIESAQKKL